MSFEQMADELELLAKSRKQEEKEVEDDDEKKIADAADGGGDAAAELPGGDVKEADEAEGEDGESESDEKGGKKGKPFGKSFMANIDGKEVEAFDATDLIKSLSAQVEEINGQRAAENASLTKALNTTHEILKSQGEEIAMLKSQIETLSNAGRGRKTVVTIAEKQTSAPLAKSQSGGVSSGEFMAKCLAAQKSGRISAFDVGRANIALESGLAVPPDVVARMAE